MYSQPVHVVGKSFLVQTPLYCMSYLKKALTFLKKGEIPITGIWIDCGCGYGVYTEALTVLGAHTVVAIDNTFSRLHHIPPPIQVVAGDCAHLPIKNSSVSGVLYSNVLHYYSSIHPFIKEAYRVLKNKGYILFIEYYQRTATVWDPYPLTINDLKAALNNYFQVITTGFVDTEYRPKQIVAAKTKKAF